MGEVLEYTARREPYEVGRFVYLPDTRPYVFYLKLKYESLKVVGVLERIVSSFTRLKIPILQLKMSVPHGVGRMLRMIIIADLSNCEEEASRLVSELGKIPMVVDVEYDKPLFDGVAVDARSFPLTLMGERIVITRKVIYKDLFKKGWEKIGSSYGALLYLIGFEIGRDAFRNHYRITGDRKMAFELNKKLFQLVGYGILEDVEINDHRRRAIVRIHGSFECELFKGSGGNRGSLLKGIVAGWFAEYWGGVDFNEIIAIETNCIARGDPYCEYLIEVKKST
ncbi:MAG: hypothetical protein J7L38_06010 [Thermoproteales archaeon]|nr:hypothetical protein [Thermoproteales archaeon]